jgi:hypothetical protein
MWGHSMRVGESMFRKLCLAFVAAFAITAATEASAFTKPPFPRIGGVHVGNPHNYDDPAYQAAIAKESVALLGYWPGFKPGGQSYNSIVEAIKARNPNTLIFTYVDESELADASITGSSMDAYRAKIDAMKWWLYSDKAMTKRVQSFYGPGYYMINNTEFTPKDSSGYNAVDWMTHFYVDNYYKVNPAIDGFFMDNVFEKPHEDGDWQRDGEIISKNDPRAGEWVRQGFARYFKLVETLMPGKYQLGNIAEWGDPVSGLTDYKGLLNGGLIEGVIGKSWSIENWLGWSGMMDRYRLIMATLAEPKLAIFGQWGDPKDYQAFRYGFASCLVGGDAYYAFTDNAKGYTGVVWFDEYDHKLGSASPPPTAAWQKGVWRRDFDNGIVLVNPKGNGPQTVTLETDYVKIKGTQDPTVNSGQTVKTVTLKDRDGLVLLRKTPVKRPRPPRGITVQQ